MLCDAKPLIFNKKKVLFFFYKNGIIPLLEKFRKEFENGN